jgi:dTDP-4-amino-4,6-dideoxygalactose transaminase
MEKVGIDRIRLFVPTFQIEDCLLQIRECLELGWTGSGFKTIEFEKAWAAYNSVPESIFLSSNSVGLDLALRGMKTLYGWNVDAEVVSTPLTFVSTNHAILLNGLKPIFADVDDSLCLDPISVRKVLTKKTKAIMYVGIGGNAANLAEMRAICEEFSLKLIIDAAHMAGTRLEGRPFDQLGDATIYSFQAVKNLPTADSGAIYVKDETLRRKIRQLSWLGISSDTFARSNSGSYKWMYDVEELGLKANGNSIMAAIALAQLKVLDNDNKTRAEIVKKYKNNLSENRLIQWPRVPIEVSSSWHLAQVRIKKGLRDSAIAFLDSRGVDAGVHYRMNTRYPMYSKNNSDVSYAQNAEHEILSLPLHLRLSEDDVKRVTDALNEFEAKN